MDFLAFMTTSAARSGPLATGFHMHDEQQNIVLSLPKHRRVRSRVFTAPFEKFYHILQAPNLCVQIPLQ